MDGGKKAGLRQAAAVKVISDECVAAEMMLKSKMSGEMGRKCEAVAENQHTEAENQYVPPVPDNLQLRLDSLPESKGKSMMR